MEDGKPIPEVITILVFTGEICGAPRAVQIRSAIRGFLSTSVVFRLSPRATSKSAKFSQAQRNGGESSQGGGEKIGATPFFR
jgi:hypothetical protein